MVSILCIISLDMQIHLWRRSLGDRKQCSGTKALGFDSSPSPMCASSPLRLCLLSMFGNVILEALIRHTFILKWIHLPSCFPYSNKISGFSNLSFGFLSVICWPWTPLDWTFLPFLLYIGLIIDQASFHSRSEIEWVSSQSCMVTVRLSQKPFLISFFFRSKLHHLLKVVFFSFSSCQTT